MSASVGMRHRLNSLILGSLEYLPGTHACHAITTNTMLAPARSNRSTTAANLICLCYHIAIVHSAQERMSIGRTR